MKLVPASDPLSDADALRLGIITLWQSGRYDTVQIAALTKVFEAKVYNVLAQWREERATKKGNGA